MQILLTGSHGLIGSALLPLLEARGHQVTRLVRSRPQSGSEAFWDAQRGELDAALVQRSDAIIHLGGESVATRWTEAKRQEIIASRLDSTRLLSEAVARSGGRQVLVCASAIGFYGDRGDEILDETSSSGGGFLARVCREWEGSAEPARAAGARVVSARLGVVLSPEGGALKAMLPAFRLGLGGPLGSGRQWLSWISLLDAARALAHLAEESSISGPANLTAPNPARSKDFARALGHALHRPALIPAPRFALKLMLGDAADEMLLFSQRVRPQVLEASGFEFEHARLDEALGSLLGS